MDEELRELFKAECEEHLSTLEAGLLRLEAVPGDSGTLEAVFRAAHSLKGAGRMLEIAPLEAIAHRCEDLLGTVRGGQAAFSAEMLDRLSPTLDAMGAVVRAAVAGEPHGVDVEALLARLSGVPSSPPSSAVPIGEVVEDTPATDFRNGEVEIADRENTVSETLAASPPASAMESETIRVASAKLDALIQIAGELSVTAERLRRSLARLDDLATLWEEGERICNSVSRTTSANAALSASEARWRERMGHALEDMRRLTGAESSRITSIADEIEEKIRELRLLPLSGVLNPFKRAVRDLARAQEKEVRLVLEGGETTADKRILEEIKDPLIHMVRNAIDHGIETSEERVASGKPPQATLTLRASQTSARVIVEIEDDGRGLNLDAIRQSALRRHLHTVEELREMSDEETQMLIFAPGFSTRSVVSDMSGRGVGMDIVRSNVERLKGTVEVRSVSGQGCLFRLVFPITLVTTRVLLCRVGLWTCGIPVETVEGARFITREALFRLEGRTTLSVDDRPVSVALLTDLLEIPVLEANAPPSTSAIPCILLRIGAERFGIVVDALLDEQEIMLKPLGGLLREVPSVAGATILGTGEICMVLNITHLAARLKQHRFAPAALSVKAPEAARRILLVEDSITTRTWEKRFLETAGYEVVTCADGEEGFAQIQRQSFDAVVSDIEMPRMDGMALTERIRSDERYKEMPVVLVTTRSSDEDRKRGLAVGADAYIVKEPLEKDSLLNALKRLI
jgi:two-component system chemotaxis sensor kinase CheA